MGSSLPLGYSETPQRHDAIGAQTIAVITAQAGIFRLALREAETGLKSWGIFKRRRHRRDAYLTLSASRLSSLVPVLPVPLWNSSLCVSLWDVPQTFLLMDTCSKRPTALPKAAWEQCAWPGE